MEDTLARTLAVAALIVSLATLAWNVYAWHRSGHRVRVESAHGATPKDGVIRMRVRNVGRSPVRVTGVGLRLNSTKPWPDGAKFPTPVIATLDNPGMAGQPELPYLLEATESVEWEFHLGQLYQDARRQSHLIDVDREYLGRPCVFLGTGEVVKSRATRFIAVRFRERRDQLHGLSRGNLGSDD